ncbi:TetR/AcrR family transcriptional regulator [Hoeflea sp. TYP-13]|uniref:TetR/AcrR family transcriptional regulator n=1 Tax=Hoeflea sp. TYP-13 TaxID=3230023 RepID=UPI0034C62074
MARPSLKNERREQILTAYVSTVSKHGLSGATLEAIASEAELKRPLVRHHLGNKEAMFEQLVEHVIGEFSKQTRQLMDVLPPSGRVEALIEILLGAPQDKTTPELVFAFAELTMKSVSDRVLASRLAASVAEFETALATEIHHEYSSVPKARIRAVAHGIASIYFNSVSLAPLALGTSEARSAADILIQSLREKKRTK